MTQLSDRFTSVLLVKINDCERFPFVLFSGEILSLSELPDTWSEKSFPSAKRESNLDKVTHHFREEFPLTF